MLTASATHCHISFHFNETVILACLVVNTLYVFTGKPNIVDGVCFFQQTFTPDCCTISNAAILMNIEICRDYHMKLVQQVQTRIMG